MSMARSNQLSSADASAAARSAEIRKMLENSKKSPYDGKMLSTMHEFEGALERELRQVVFEQGIALSSDAIQKLEDVRQARIMWELERARAKEAGIPHLTHGVELDRLNRELQNMRRILSSIAVTTAPSKPSPPRPPVSLNSTSTSRSRSPPRPQAHAPPAHASLYSLPQSQTSPPRVRPQVYPDQSTQSSLYSLPRAQASPPRSRPQVYPAQSTPSSLYSLPRPQASPPRPRPQVSPAQSSLMNRSGTSFSFQHEPSISPPSFPATQAMHARMDSSILHHGEVKSRSEDEMIREIEGLFMKVHGSSPTADSLVAFSLQALSIDISPYFLRRAAAAAAAAAAPPRHPDPPRHPSPPPPSPPPPRYQPRDQPAAQCICGSPLSEQRLFELRALAEAHNREQLEIQEAHRTIATDHSDHDHHLLSPSYRDLNYSQPLPPVVEEGSPQNGALSTESDPVIPSQSPPMSPPRQGEILHSPIHTGPGNGIKATQLDESNGGWYAEVQGATMEVGGHDGESNQQQTPSEHPRQPAMAAAASATEDDHWDRLIEKSRPPSEAAITISQEPALAVPSSAASLPRSQRDSTQWSLVQTGQNGSEVVLTGGDGLAQKLEGVLGLLQEDGVLKSLRLTHGNMGGLPSAMSRLARPIEAHRSLTLLDLSDNHIDDQGVAFLGTSLCSNNSLRFVSLSGNDIGPAGGRHMAQALKQNISLQALDMSRNQLGPSGVSCVAMALNFNVSLQALHLHSNDATDSGASFLAEALRRQGAEGMELGQQPPALRSLGLADNGISSKGAAALSDALDQNSTLTVLQLGTQHQIAPRVLHGIESRIARNKMEQLHRGGGIKPAVEWPFSDQAVVHGWA